MYTGILHQLYHVYRCTTLVVPCTQVHYTSPQVSFLNFEESGDEEEASKADLEYSLVDDVEIEGWVAFPPCCPTVAIMA